MLDRINKSFRYSVVSGAFFLITKARVAVLCGSSCDGFSSLHEYQRNRTGQDHVFRCFVRGSEPNKIIPNLVFYQSSVLVVSEM